MIQKVEGSIKDPQYKKLNRNYIRQEDLKHVCYRAVYIQVSSHQQKSVGSYLKRLMSYGEIGDFKFPPGFNVKIFIRFDMSDDRLAELAYNVAKHCFEADKIKSK